MTEEKESIKDIILEKDKIIDIDSFLSKKPITYPSKHAFDGQRYATNIKILKNGNILFVNELKYSTDDSYGSDFDESYIEIYNNDLTKLISQLEIKSYDEIFLLKNDTIYLRSKGDIYDISNSQFNKIGTVENKFSNLFVPKNGKNYFNGRYDYKSNNFSIEILDENLKIIKTLDFGKVHVYLRHCNNILELSDKNKNIISVLFLAGKIIFYDIKENKQIKSIDIYDKMNNEFNNAYSYDNVIEKNGQLYFCVYGQIIVINLYNLQKQFSIKLKEGQFCQCVYDLNKDNILLTLDKNIYAIYSKNNKMSKILENDDIGNPIRFEKVNDNSFMLITSKGVFYYNIKYNYK